MEGINWPLTNVPLNRLPRFLNGEKTLNVSQIRPAAGARPVRNISAHITAPIPKTSPNRIAGNLTSVISPKGGHTQKAPNSGVKKMPAPKPPPR